MDLTVQRALTAAPLDRATVAAGNGGIDQVIAHVDVLELAELPDMADWVREGELLLTRGYALPAEVEQLSAILPLLSQKGAAGLVIRLRQDHHQLPQALLETANELRFPLIVLPGHVTYLAVLNFLLRTVSNSQLAVLRQTEAIHQCLSRLVSSGGDLGDLSEALGELLAAAVAIVGQDGEPLSVLEPELVPALKEIREEWLPGDGQQGFKRSSLVQVPLQGGMAALEEQDGDGHSIRAIASAVRIGTDTPATLLVWNLTRPVTSLDLLAIEHATTIAALKLTETQAVREAEHRHLSTFLDDLLTSRFPSTEAIAFRGRNLGWDAAAAYAVGVLAISRKRTHPDANAAAGDWHDQRLLEQVLVIIQSLFEHGLAWIREGVIALLLRCDPSVDDLEARQRRLDTAGLFRKELERQLVNVWVWVGLGSPQPEQSRLRLSYEQARAALVVARESQPQGGVADYEGLGIYKLLCSIPRRDELEVFVRNHVGVLLAYDREHRMQLARTLDVFLRSDGNIRRSAARLWVHPNTVKYRLGRIEKLIGPVRRQPENRLAVEVALRALRLLASHDPESYPEWTRQVP